MLSFGVSVRRNQLPRIQRILRGEVEDITTGAARIGVKVAKARVAVLTGALQANIHAETKGLDAKIVASLDYAAVIEFGGVNRAAQPYMRPGALAAQLYIRAELASLAGRLER
jgi:hypothetical protein